MSRKQAEIVSINALNHIIKYGTQMAKDNKTIKNHLFSYSSRQGLIITNHLIVQAGAQEQKSSQYRNQEQVASNNKRDNRFCNSINSSPAKPDNKPGKLGISSRQTATHRSSRHPNRSDFLVSRKQSLHSRAQNRFIDLTDILEPPCDDKKITPQVKTQRNHIQRIRQRKIYLEQNAKKRQEQQAIKAIKDKQRNESLKSRIHQHMSKKHNSISFDTDGNYIFVEAQDQQNALKKRFPPQNIKFNFDEPKQLIIQPNQTQIKEKAARGQIFASSVLKTMNISKFSLNMTSKTCNIDQFSFMKRNDLFNNNHSRQVTTIPFLQITQGANYTETHTKVSVGKKTQRTSHSENKSKFKTHNILDQLKQNFQKNSNKTEFIQYDLKIDQKRIQSSRPYMRPKTCTPKTAKTTDRITSVNQHLVCELIE